MSRTVAIAGASGLIGSALAESLRARGDRVITLVRRPATQADERSWNLAEGTISDPGVEDVDAVVNLAGAGVGDRRWSTAYKRQILRSRVDGTRTLATAIERSGRPVRFVCGSAVGYYGNRGEEVLTDDSSPGTGFLADVVRAWEAAAKPAARSGSVVFARTGIVASDRGGAFAPLVRLARFGLGGPIGRGRFFWPLISLADEVAALTFLIDRPEMTGPVNLTAPNPYRQGQIAAELARAVHRPAVLPAPPLAVRLVVGEFAQEITASQRVFPDRLRQAGFVHQDSDLPAIVAAALG